MPQGEPPGQEPVVPHYAMLLKALYTRRDDDLIIVDVSYWGLPSSIQSQSRTLQGSRHQVLCSQISTNSTNV